MLRDPVYLAWMVPALLAAGLFFARGLRRRGQIARKLGHPETLSRLIPPESASRRAWKAWLQAAALALIFVALSGPQWGVELVATEAKTHQIVLAVDTSLSMTAQDIKPSRLEKAKREFSLLLDELGGNRVGVIAFAGEAALVCPMTTDFDAAKQILNSLEPGMLPVPGTGIGKAIRLAAQTLQRYPGMKSLVLITDGEDHKTEPLAAAEKAAAGGIRIFAIGIGTPEGEPIPLKDPSGALTGYKKDRQGQTVITRLGERTLAELAARTGGAYFRSSPQENEALEIAERILKTERSEKVGSTAHQYRNRYLFPLALAFLILLIELLIPERRMRPKASLASEESTPNERAAGRASTLAALLIVLCLPRGLQAAAAEGALRRGNRLYGKKLYAPALEEYFKAGALRPKDPRPPFNAGDAFYRLDELDRAAEAFSALAQSKEAPDLRAQAYYNLGNIHFQKGDYKQAVEDYRKALGLGPKDLDARHNLALALRFLKNPPPQKKGGGKEQQKEKEQPQDQSGSGQNQPSPPRTRPQDEISKEDAERILRAVAEREKLLKRQVQKRAPESRPPQTEEDW